MNVLGVMQVADIMVMMRQEGEPPSDFLPYTVVAVVAVACHLMKASGCLACMRARAHVCCVCACAHLCVRVPSFLSSSWPVSKPAPLLR